MQCAKRFGTLTAAIGIAACAHASEGERAVESRGITSYPFFASPQRAEFILSQLERIKSGMSRESVEEIFGQPDEILMLYEPIKLNPKAIGYTHWYVIRRLTGSGSVLAKNEQSVRIAYNFNDIVTSMDRIKFNKDCGLSE